MPRGAWLSVQRKIIIITHIPQGGRAFSTKETFTFLKEKYKDSLKKFVHI